MTPQKLSQAQNKDLKALSYSELDALHLECISLIYSKEYMDSFDGFKIRKGKTPGAHYRAVEAFCNKVRAEISNRI